MRPTYLDDGNLGTASARLEDLVSGTFPLETIMKSFGGEWHAVHLKFSLIKAGNPNVSTKGMIGSPFHDNTHAQQHLLFPATSKHSLTFRPHQTEPNFNLVDMDELSASLGLPRAKNEAATTESPAHSHKSRASQGVSDELYGTLLGKAREKPLTANDLAYLLRNQSRSDTSEETIRAPREMQDPFTEHARRAPEQGQALKMVHPPPGFSNQMARMVAVEEDHIPAAPAAMRHHFAPTPQPNPAYHHRQNISQSSASFQQLGQSSAPFQQHVRRPSSRRRPRTHTRTKRTDQGPEPSAADIYPDDADWPPPQPPHRSYFAPPPHQPKPQPTLHMEQTAHWPTPAEVYTLAPPQQPLTHPKQGFDIFEAHVPPSPDDMSAADGDVLSLINELPDPSIDTLIRFGAFDLLPEEQPLTPMQESGKRYGMNFFGIGLGDDWVPPAAGENEPFRVRPRDHEGWGGWEWAIKKGWGNE
jgi:hypothetical protein